MLVALLLLLLRQESADPASWAEREENFYSGGCVENNYSIPFILIPPDITVKEPSVCCPLLSSQTFCSQKFLLLQMHQHQLIFSAPLLSKLWVLASCFFMIKVSVQLYTIDKLGALLLFSTKLNCFDVCCWWMDEDSGKRNKAKYRSKAKGDGNVKGTRLQRAGDFRKRNPRGGFLKTVMRQGWCSFTHNHFSFFPEQSQNVAAQFLALSPHKFSRWKLLGLERNIGAPCSCNNRWLRNYCNHFNDMAPQLPPMFHLDLLVAIKTWFPSSFFSSSVYLKSLSDLNLILTNTDSKTQAAKKLHYHRHGNISHFCKDEAATHPTSQQASRAYI